MASDAENVSIWRHYDLNRIPVKVTLDISGAPLKINGVTWYTYGNLTALKLDRTVRAGMHSYLHSQCTLLSPYLQGSTANWSRDSNNFGCYDCRSLFQYEDRLFHVHDSIIMMRQYWGRLIFKMVIVMLVKQISKLHKTTFLRFSLTKIIRSWSLQWKCQCCSSLILAHPWLWDDMLACAILKETLDWYISIFDWISLFCHCWQLQKFI